MITAVDEAHSRQVGWSFLAALLICTVSLPVNAAPTLDWIHPVSRVAVGVGQSTATTASFTVSEMLDDIQLWVAPELAPYVAVTPNVIDTLEAGGIQTVHLTVNAPPGTPLGLYEGTLHVRVKTRTIAKPLYMAIEVVWPTLDSREELGFSLQYPPGWHVLQGDNDIAFSNVIARSELSDTALLTEAFFQVRLRQDDNLEGLSLDQWFDETIRPLVSESLDHEEFRLVDGRAALYVEISGVGGRKAHYFILDGSDVLEVTYGLYAPAFLPDYEQMLKSLSIGQQ